MAKYFSFLILDLKSEPNSRRALLTILIFFSLTACSSVHPKISSKIANHKSGVAVDIDDSLLGTWVQASISCGTGEFTEEGKQASVAFKSGMTAAKAVVTSDRVFWDMKEYRDVENPNDFCQVSVEERWTSESVQDPSAIVPTGAVTGAVTTGTLVVSGSEAIVTGNGQVVCDKKYKYSSARKHSFRATEKNLTITLSSTHDAQTGVTSSEKELCKSGPVILGFQRDGGDE